jgi:hypothetical protein
LGEQTGQNAFRFRQKLKLGKFSLGASSLDLATSQRRSSKQRSKPQLDNIDAADTLTASAVLVASMERATISPGLAASAGIFQLL